MSKEFDDLRRRVYGSANPTEEQVQAVRKRAQAPVRKPTGRNPEIKKDALVNAITSSIAKNVTGPGNLRTAQASGRISGGFSGRQDDLPSYISRAAGTATAQSDAVLRTDPVRTQAPNTAANPAGRSAQKDFSLLELLGGTVVKGADEAVSRATSTAAWLERNTIGRLFPGAADDTPIQALNEHFQNVKQENQEAFAPNVEAGGRLAQVVDKYGTSVVSAIPSAALAVMTAGTAPAGLEAAASAASRSPGILSALQASAQNMTKNPQFWNSFFQVAGSSYDEALSLGMSEDEADLYALANGLLSSGVEIGGGLETLPSNLKDSSGALRAWIRGMMEEGREEVVQGAISRGLQNMIGSVGNPLVSATDERAVFNPRTAAEEFTGGAVVGGFLGGGQVLAGRLLNGPTAAQEGAGDSGGAGAPGAQDGAQGVLGQNKPPPEGGMVNENGLHAFSEQERINLSSGKKNKVISTFSEAVSFVKNALSNRQNVDRAYLGKVPDSVARTIRQNTGLDIRGFGVMMNGNDIRHMIKNHGDILTEQARGQVAVTADDIARIPEILAAPDRVYLSDETDTKGRKTLIFEKQIGDQYISIQGVSDGKRVLQTDTLYIRKGRPRTTRDTMPGTESAVPVINAQGEPSQKPSSIDVTIPQDAEYVNSVDPLLRWMLGSRPTAAQEGAGAAAGQKMGTDAAQVRGGSEGVQDAWRDTIVNEVRRNSGIGENESPASTSDGTSALSGDLETVVDAWDMAAIPGTVGTVTDGRASQVAPISTVQETGINVNHQEGQNRIRNTGETVRVVETLRDHIPKLSEAEPVSEVSSNSIPFVSGKTMAEKAKTLFEAIKGIVSRPGFGDIEINTRSVKDDLHHGIGTAKAAVIPAIPDIIRTGTQIDFQENWKGRPYDGYIFAAPVTMDGKTVYVAAVVKHTSKNRFYLHEVVDSDGNIIKIDAGDSANQTSLATNGSAGTQSQASVEGTRTLNPDSIIAPRAENVNPPDGLGAANAGSLNTAYDRLQAQSSQFHPEGANAARPVDVPVQDFAGRNVSRVASNVMGAQAIPDSVVSMIEQMVAGGELSYDRNTNDASLERARRRIQEKGFDGALEEFRSSVMDGRVSKDLSTLGQTLLNTAANNRDGRAVADILSLYQSMTTSAAQATQAASIFRRVSPEAQLYGIQRTAQNLANKISRNNQDYGEIEVDPELLTKFLEQTDQAGRDAVMGEIYQNVADQVPSTFVDKWNAWRYLSMLGNPRTHIRNVVGNVFFQPMRIVKNEVAAGIETALSAAGFNVERTKSFAASPSMYRAAWNDFNNVKDSVSGNKYNDFNNQINQRRRIFNNSILEAARKKNGDALELEDALFKRITYADTLAGYLTANGFTAQQVTDGTVPPDVLNRGRDYAAKEALKATYQDRNALSDRAVKVVNSLGVVGDAVIPFKRTPANVLARGLTYSPLGLVKSLTYDLSQVQRGNRTAAEVIDNIASGATGSMLFALGAYLFSSGLLTTAQGSDDDSKWEELLGHQGYALELPDGTSVTLDWLAPASMPFFMGAEMASAMGENGMSAEAISTAMKSVANPLLEMSMLQSLNDLLESVAYSEDKALIPMLGSAVVSYFSQAIPTLGGQLERSAEDRRMTTYTDKNSPLPTDVQYALGRASSRVPGWDYRQTPYLDAWGREEETGDELWRILNNFANPAYVSQVEVDRVEEELQRVRDATGDTGVFPDRAKRYIEVNGERKDLTAEEYTRYAKAMGQTSYQLISEGIQTAEYRNMANSEKAAYIESLYKYAAAAAKAEVSDYELDGWQKNAQTAQQDLGVSPAEYIALYQQYGSAIMSGKAYEKTIQAVQAGLTVGQYASMKAGLDSDGNNSVSQTEAQAYLDRQDFTREQKADLWTIINKSWKRNPYT